MIWLVTSEEDMAVLAEINLGASDRALGIIGASLVEIHLTKLIKQAFITETGTETIQERMFQSGGPLGAFATKIRLSLFNGIDKRGAFRESRNHERHSQSICPSY